MQPGSTVVWKVVDRILTLLANGGGGAEEGKQLWDTTLLGNGWTQDEADRWFVRFSSTHPPTLKRGFPRSTSPWPVIACQLLSDRPGARPLGGTVGVDRVGGLRMVGGLRHAGTAVVIYGKDDDEIDVYHVLLDALITRERDWAMDENGGDLCDAIVYENATDVEPSPEYLPDTIVMRSIIYTVTGIRSTVQSLPDPGNQVYAHLEGVNVPDGDDTVPGQVTPIEPSGGGS